MTASAPPDSKAGAMPPASPQPPEATWSRTWLAAVAGLTLLAGLLRFIGLGRRDFWFDECCTFIYVRDLFDWPEQSNLLVESTNLPYYFLLRGWSDLFGHSEVAYRSLSAVAAALSIPILALAARHLAGRSAGLICAALAAVHPLHLYYAREARAYALWILVLSLALYLLIRAARITRWAWWAAYGAVILFALHLHYFTFYWLPASLGCVVLADNHRRTLQRWLVVHLLIALAFLPYFLAAVLPAARGGGSAWLAGGVASLTSVLESLWAFLPAGSYPEHLRGLSLQSSDTIQTFPSMLANLARVLPAILLFAAAMLVGARLRSAEMSPAAPAQTARRPSPPTHAFLAGMTLGPLLLAWLYSLLVRPNYLVARYDLVALPAALIWMSVLIADAARTRPARRSQLTAAVGTTLLLAFCSLVPLSRLLAAPSGPSWTRARATHVAEVTRPGDLVISFSFDRDWLRYYLHRAGFAGELRSFPSWLEGQLGWVDTAIDLSPQRAEALRADAATLADRVRSELATGRRVFVLVDSFTLQGNPAREPVNEVLREALLARGLRFEPVDGGMGVVRLRLHAEESGSPGA